jgi:glycosyltransferase involved in cell wall biosynthesis
VIAGCSPGSELFRVVSEVGCVVEPENSEALAKAVIDLIQNPTQRSLNGMIGRDFALQNFSQEKVLKRFLSAIQSL